MAKRETAPVQRLYSRDTAEAVLKRVGLADIEIERIGARYDKAILTLKEAAAKEAGAPAAERAKDLAALEAWYDENAPADGRKSIEFACGRIGRRTTPAELKTLKKRKWDQVIDLVKRFLGAEYIRTTEEVDKEAIHKAKFNEDTLAKAGLRLKQGEKFFAEPDRTKLGG